MCYHDDKAAWRRIQSSLQTLKQIVIRQTWQHNLYLQAFHHCSISKSVKVLRKFQRYQQYRWRAKTIHHIASVFALRRKMFLAMELLVTRYRKRQHCCLLVEYQSRKKQIFALGMVLHRWRTLNKRSNIIRDKIRNKLKETSLVRTDFQHFVNDPSFFVYGERLFINYYQRATLQVGCLSKFSRNANNWSCHALVSVRHLSAWRRRLLVRINRRIRETLSVEHFKRFQWQLWRTCMFRRVYLARALPARALQYYIRVRRMRAWQQWHILQRRYRDCHSLNQKGSCHWTLVVFRKAMIQWKILTAQAVERNNISSFLVKRKGMRLFIRFMQLRKYRILVSRAALRWSYRCTKRTFQSWRRMARIRCKVLQFMRVQRRFKEILESTRSLTDIAVENEALLERCWATWRQSKDYNRLSSSTSICHDSNTDSYMSHFRDEVDGAEDTCLRSQESSDIGSVSRNVSDCGDISQIVTINDDDYEYEYDSGRNRVGDSDYAPVSEETVHAYHSRQNSHSNSSSVALSEPNLFDLAGDTSLSSTFDSLPYPRAHYRSDSYSHIHSDSSEKNFMSETKVEAEMASDSTIVGLNTTVSRGYDSPDDDVAASIYSEISSNEHVNGTCERNSNILFDDGYNCGSADDNDGFDDEGNDEDEDYCGAVTNIGLRTIIPPTLRHSLLHDSPGHPIIGSVCSLPEVLVSPAASKPPPPPPLAAAVSSLLPPPSPPSPLLSPISTMLHDDLLKGDAKRNRFQNRQQQKQRAIQPVLTSYVEGHRSYLKAYETRQQHHSVAAQHAGSLKYNGKENISVARIIASDISAVGKSTSNHE